MINMKVFVDKIQIIQPKSKRVAKHGDRWCHLWCEDGDEKYLHEIALKIGLKKEYFQQTKISHYDLTPSKRAKAIAAGAIERSTTEYLTRKIKGKIKS